MKKGVKKMPNHEKVVLKVKVLNHEKGKNRLARRKDGKIARGVKMFAKKQKALAEHFDLKKTIRERVARKTKKAQERKAERNK